MRRRHFTLPIALLLAMPLALPAAAAYDRAPGDEAAYDPVPSDDYASGDYGRLRYLDDDVVIRRAEDDGERLSASTNAPVFPGDALATDVGARAEVELAGGQLVWLDGSTALKFLSLPSPYAENEDRTVLQLLEGTIRLERPRRAGGDVRIDATGGTVWIGDGADVRLEADGDALRVWVFRGSADLGADDGSVRLVAGTRTTVRAGGGIGAIRDFNTLVADRFDDFVLDRRELYATYEEADYDDIDLDEVYDDTPREVRPYWRELNRHGRWIYVAGHGYVWSPRGVRDDWRPYRDGYWAYGPRGYFWVSYEPWGWAPYHYGRWNYLSGYGWCWLPGRVFGGAWVSWSYGSLYLGWAPLNWWNRPVYYGSLYSRYYDPYCWNFIRYSHLGTRSYHHVYVGFDRVRDRLGRHAIVTRAPRVAPRDLAGSRETRERAIRTARNEGRVFGGEALDRRREGRGFRDLEGRVATRRPPRDDSTTGGGRRDGERAGRPGGGRTPPVAAERPGRAGGTRDGRTDLGRRDRTNPGRSAAGVERAAPGRGNANAARERARDLYRRLTGPRETAPRGRDRATRESEDRTTARPPARRDGAERARPTPPSRDRVRPGTPSRDRVRPEAPSRERVRPGTPSRERVRPSTPSRERVRPSTPSRERVRPSTPSRERVRPSTPSRERVRPSAPSRERVRPSTPRPAPRPRAAPSRGSGNSRPKAAPSRPAPRPRAAPKRSGGGSKPKASPSRGSGRSDGKSGSRGRGKRDD